MERITFFIRENLRLLIGLFVVLFLIVLAITLILNRKTPEVLINNQTFKVMIADEEKERSKGLSGKKKIKENQGMLFLFDKPGYPSFWMNDMKFSIDIIYINGNKVTTIFKNVKAPDQSNNNLEIYNPSSESDKVLEINAGLADKYNIKEGSEISITNL